VNEHSQNDSNARGERLSRLVEAVKTILQEGRVPQEQELIAKCPGLEPASIKDTLPAVMQMLGELTTGGGGPGAAGDAEPSLVPGACLGEFVLDRPIGAGGMGVVWKARQQSLNRWVALKVFAPGRPDRADGLNRFWREAEGVSRREHPSIVPVYQRGEQDGWHYYARQLIDGLTLKDIIEVFHRLRGLPCQESATELARELARQFYGSCTPGGDSPCWRSLAARLADIADALYHAHRNGIIHRDVKPSNILAGQERPDLADGLRARPLGGSSGCFRPADARRNPPLHEPGAGDGRGGGSPHGHRLTRCDARGARDGAAACARGRVGARHGAGSAPAPMHPKGY